LVIDRAILTTALPPIAADLAAQGVMLACDDASFAVLEHTADIPADRLRPAAEEDWACEYIDLIMSVKVVDGIDEAIEHINRYSTQHSEAIVTDDYAAARRFTADIDSAAVYVNASTRFTDGGVFGLGAEIGISTQKLHARGPMGLAALTSTKFILEGNGQTRE